MHVKRPARPVRGYELAKVFPDLFARVGVFPLGVDGGLILVRREIGRLCDGLALKPGQLGRRGILVLTQYQVRKLCDMFPRDGAARGASDWDHQLAAETLIELCARRGVIAPRMYGFFRSGSERWLWKGVSQ